MNPRMETTGQVLNIPIEDIIPNRFQPRLSFDEEGLRELASSIKEHGIIQPLVVRRLNDKYEIIAGERRYKAARLAGLSSVPGIISEMDDKKSAEVAIVENVQRKDLSSIEEAKSYKALLDKGYLTQDELAKKMGLSQSAIANKLRLLSLSPKVQDALMAGKISERHARSLLVLNDFLDQDKWLDIIINERLTVKELDRRLNKIKMDEGNNNSDLIKEKSSDKMENSNVMNEINFETVNDINDDSFLNYINNILDSKTINNSISDNGDTFLNSDLNNSKDEIELLDFELPKELKDMGKANELVEELISKMKNNNYNVKLLTNENENEIKFEIIVNKN